MKFEGKEIIAFIESKLKIKITLFNYVYLTLQNNIYDKYMTNDKKGGKKKIYMYIFKAFKIISLIWRLLTLKRIFKQNGLAITLTQSRGARHIPGFAFSHLSNDRLERWIYQTEQRTLILSCDWSSLSVFPSFFRFSFFFFQLARHFRCTTSRRHAHSSSGLYVHARYIILY